MPSKFDLAIYIVSSILILGFFFSVTLNFEPCISYDEVMTDDGFIIHACRTGSMCDLDYSDYMACTPDSIDDLSVGDIIFFKKFESIAGITHRIIDIDIDSDEITTQGDCNQIADHPIPFENVVWVLGENCD